MRTKTRVVREVARKAEMPRFRRGKERPSIRNRKAQDDEEMPFEDDMPLDDEFDDIDLDEILEMDEDAFEPVDEDEVGECPPGCVPAPVKDDEEAVDEEEEEGEEKEEGDEKEEGEEDEKEEEKDSEEKEAAVAPKTEAEPKKEAATEPVAEPVKDVFAALYSTDEINSIEHDAEMAMYYHEDPEDPHYIVIANGKPLGEIHRKDLNLDDSNKALFSAEEFPKHVMASISELGLANCVDSLNMRYYGAKVTDAAAQGRADAMLTAAMKGEVQVKLAELKTKLLDNVKLAMDASLKNVFLDNPLRDALRARIASLGAPDAVAVELIEDAMQAAGGKYFGMLVDQANEWMGFEPEALKQMEKTIHSARYASPAERGMEIDHAIPQQPNKVPMIRTMAPRQAAAQQPDETTNRSLQSLKSGLIRSSTILRGRR